MNPSLPSDSSAQMNSPSYLLAVEDKEFLLRDELRAIRFALEYAKAEVMLRDWGVRSTIIVFGSARILSPEELAALPEPRTDEERSVRERHQKQVRWYEEARQFARIVSDRGGARAPHDRWRDNVIATGGGPGIMQAANRGAWRWAHPASDSTSRCHSNNSPTAFPHPNSRFVFITSRCARCT